MAIDTTPSTVANNALNALDFSALIGGPMEAIVKAQALAAQTTYEFINEVGLTVDPDTGEKKPIYVTFEYNNNGQKANLTVPLLAILTIPNIEVTQFVIDFIANISASSSSTEETSTDTDLGVEAEAEASIGVGPFSLKVRAKANYSSKQHSKAAQDSRYSVEYTMNVHVEGGQGGMPAGLQTVLNILQASNSTVNLDDMVQPFPSQINLDLGNTDTTTLQITVKDRQGYFAPGTEVRMDYPSDFPFEVSVNEGYNPADVVAARANLSRSSYSTERRTDRRRNINQLISPRVVLPYLRRFGDTYQNTINANEDENDPSLTAVTNLRGRVIFNLKAKENITTDMQGTFRITGQIPVSGAEGQTSYRPEIASIPYAVLAPTLENGSLEINADVDSITLNGTNQNKTVTATLTSPTNGDTIEGETILFEIVDLTGVPAADQFDNDTSEGQTDGNGKISFDVKLKNAPTQGNGGTYNLKVFNDSSDTLEIPITVEAPTALQSATTTLQA